MQHPAIDSSWQHGYETITPASSGFTHYTLRPLPYERVVQGWHFTATSAYPDEEGVSPRATAELIVSNRVVAQQPLRELLLPDGLELFMREVRGRLAWLEEEARLQREAILGSKLPEENPQPSIYPGELEVPLYVRKNEDLQVRINGVPDHLEISAVLRGVIKLPEV